MSLERDLENDDEDDYNREEEVDSEDMKKNI